MTTAKPVKDEIDVINKIVEGVLADKSSTTSEKIQAGNLLLKAMQIKHKITDTPDSKEDSFFRKK